MIVLGDTPDGLSSNVILDANPFVNGAPDFVASGNIGWTMPDGSVIAQSPDGSVIRGVPTGKPGEYTIVQIKGPDADKRGRKEYTFARVPKASLALLDGGNAPGMILPKTEPIVTLETVTVRPEAADPDVEPENEAEVTASDIAKSGAVGLGKGLVDSVEGLYDAAKLTSEGFWYIVSQPIETSKALVWGAGEVVKWGAVQGQEIADALYMVNKNPGAAWDAAAQLAQQGAEYAAQHPDQVAEGVGRLAGNLAGGGAAAKVMAKAGVLAKGGKVLDDIPKGEPAPPKPKPKEEPKPQSEPEPGGKVKAKRIKEHEVPCFEPRNKKFKRMNTEQQRKYLQEYTKQLRRQQAAINEMTAAQFKAARDAFARGGRNAVAVADQSAFRKDFGESIRKSIESSLQQGGRVDSSKIKALAAAQTQSLMSQLDALHEPDMVAGGWLRPETTAMGQSNVNKAIGGNWPHKGRIKGMETSADDAIKSGEGSSRMNVQMKPCPPGKK